MTTYFYQEWRDENANTKYPFSPRASLTTRSGQVIADGVFLDASLYPAGWVSPLYLANVSVGHQKIVFTLGCTGNAAIATGEASTLTPPDVIALQDSRGRPAGVLVSEPLRLASFTAWGVGSYSFTPQATEFVASCCPPAPAPGLRGILLADGTLLTGEVWLIGSDGVVLSVQEQTVPASCAGPARTVQTLRIDVVGDPLFRRRLCSSNDLFSTPNFIKKLSVVAPNQSFDVVPGANGAVRLAANNALASDTVLRVVQTPDGITLQAVGQTQGG